MERRSFLKAVGASGGMALGAERRGAVAGGDTGPVAGLPRRVLGGTGRKVSIVAFPGLALIHYDQEECTRGLRAALDRGVDYFDVAPAYGKGQCETKMGAGLAGVARDRYFLACKTKARDKAGAREDLERSLKLLKTDHFDLYQLHHMRWADEVEQVLAPGGAMETLVEAKRQGHVRTLGFSAHTSKAALMLLERFPFDTAMFPINYVELLRYGFGKQVLELAEKKGAAVLAIKAMSRGAWPKDARPTRKWWYRPVEDAEEVDLAVRFALSQPAVAAAFPPAFLDLLDKAVEAGRNFRPITPAEVQRLRLMALASEPVFQKDEARAAMGLAVEGTLLGETPYDGPCDRWA